MGEKYASNSYHNRVRLALVVGFQPRGSRTHLSHDPRFRACQTLALIIALVVIGILVVVFTSGAFPTGVVLTNILLAAIFAPLFVRIICCAYE